MGTESADWRPMERGDLPRAEAIGNAIHTLVERAEVVEEKFDLYPQGCFSLDLDGDILGYGLCHPWRLQAVPPLDLLLGELPAAPECLHIHDVALLPEARGHTHASRLVGRLGRLAQSEGLTTLALVSVYGTSPFWTKRGFQVAADQLAVGNLASYGPTARYMTRTLV